MYYLFHFKLPPHAGNKRVLFWCKVRAWGAVHTGDGVYILPKSEEASDLLKTLKKDIVEAGGEFVLLTTADAPADKPDKVQALFVVDRNQHYETFIAECDKFEKDVAEKQATGGLTFARFQEKDSHIRSLEDWFERIQSVDFYGAPLAPKAEKQLQKCLQLFLDYLDLVYDANEGNAPTED